MDFTQSLGHSSFSHILLQSAVISLTMLSPAVLISSIGTCIPFNWYSTYSISIGLLFNDLRLKALDDSQNT